MKKRHLILPLLAAGILAVSAKDNRGLFAFLNGNILQVSWRMRATDNPKNTQYELYADGQKVATMRSKTTVRLSSASYADSKFSLIVKDSLGHITDQQDGVTVNPSEVIDIPMNAPEAVKAPGTDSTIISYTPGDASAYDMDGDGEQEIIMKWMPSDLMNTTYNIPAHEYLDCYKLNGTRLWRIDMGQNIGAGNNFPYMVWDFDGDGKGELICKSAPGTKDASGNYVGKGLPGYDTDLEKVYYRGHDKLPTKGEEWITCFDGENGKELASRKYWPYFNIQSEWNPDGNSDGASYGRRGNGFKGAVIKIPCRDGQVRPVCYMQRGIYTYVYATAISWDGKNLTEEWRHSSYKGNSITTNATGTHNQKLSLYGQGCHAGQAADLDGDGYDEVCIGAATIDHDGTVLWSTGLGHGDMLSVGELNPYNEGLETWRITEGPTKYDACMIDGKTGTVLNGQLVHGGDVGRGLCLDLDSTQAGTEYWQLHSDSIYDCKGKGLYLVNRGNITGYPNFRIFWDGDLTDEHFDGKTIAKYDIVNHGWSRLTTLWKEYKVNTINSTKQNACLQCDLIGDFREELAMYANASSLGRSDCDYVLRIITSTFDTNKKLPWLRDDNTYNLQIASQNVGYSQSPHLGYNAYALYRSWGQMGKDEISSNETKVFSPDINYYYMLEEANDGYFLAYDSSSKGFVQASESAYDIEFIPTSTAGVYLLRSADGKYLRDGGKYGLANTTDSTKATPYLGTVEGSYVYFTSTTASNGNKYIYYDSKRKGFARGSNMMGAARFSLIKTNNPSTKINNIRTDAIQQTIYNINGMRLGKAQRGVNIIQNSNGKTRKVIVK